MQKIFSKISLIAATGMILAQEKVSAQTILPDGPPIGWTINAFGGMIGNTTTLALSVAGTVAGIFILIGGFEYLTAYGDQAKAESGKKTLTWAIIGLVFIIVSRVIVGEVWRRLTNTAVPN